MSTDPPPGQSQHDARVDDQRWRMARGDDTSTELDRIYESRFNEQEAASKDLVWAEVVAFLQRYVDDSQPVLDVAADRGYFIRHIRATERWATDVRDIREELGPEIKFVEANGPTMSEALPHD